MDMGFSMRVPAVLLVALVVAAIGFVAGRASAPDTAPGAAVLSESKVAESVASPVSISVAGNDPRLELLRAFEQPASVRDQAVPRALIAWVTADHAAAMVAESARTNMDSAIEAVDAMDDSELRRFAARGLLVMAETDEEAVRLGRSYGFDRDAVMELRERGIQGFGSMFVGPGEPEVRPFAFRIDLEPGTK